MYNNTLHVLLKIIVLWNTSGIWHYINLKNQKIDQNTVYPLFSRNANYAEVENICNIIFFFTKAIFTILKTLWRTQTSFLSGFFFFFFCEKKY